MANISITRALATLKSIDAKIVKQTERLDTVAVTDGQGDFRKLVGKLGTIADFSTKAETQIQSLTDMLNTRDALKAAIIQSNAVTKITIGGKEVTVAQAIEQKRSIVLRQNLLAKVKSQVNLGNALLVKRTAEFEGGLSVKLDTLLGRDRATKGEDVEGITKPLRERGEPSLLDPVGMVAYSEKLDTEIDDFLTEVDFALSESNARTEVEFTA
ncbi:hypothetical protein Hena1_01040 [Erwinia phage Hena1]|uniref:Tail fiber protein n=1 Tax=Erwinia phage Hena1 TaxID=2678601 RepID=A0A6B9J678_9CAUD|nr:tail fiber protein [Erwinia phage Hena1]QGZ16278.1 hypothetical protein Hena1_01040 [Erwinia phage Hena1]